MWVGQKGSCPCHLSAGAWWNWWGLSVRVMVRGMREEGRGDSFVPSANPLSSITVCSSFFKFSQWKWPCPQYQFSSVTQLCPTLRPHGLQHARLSCPSSTPGACSNSCALNQWCHPIISPSVVPFSSYLQSFPASGSFPLSHFFPSGGQSAGVSASSSVLPMNVQGWFPLGLTGWISLQSKGLSWVFSNTTVQKHQFFSIQLSL